MSNDKLLTIQERKMIEFFQDVSMREHSVLTTEGTLHDGREFQIQMVITTNKLDFIERDQHFESIVNQVYDVIPFLRKA